MSVLKPPVDTRPDVDPRVLELVRVNARVFGVSEIDAACITIQELRAMIYARGLGEFLPRLESSS